MPTIYELFGFPISDRGKQIESQRRVAHCPFMEATCDGGGNRHQTKIRLSDGEPLSAYFDAEMTSVIPGVCSIAAGNDIWSVCPRRLFAAKNTVAAPPTVNAALQPHERAILLQAALPSDHDIGIWSEVYLKQKVADAEINYHFDYIAAPLVESTLRHFLHQFAIAEDTVEQEILNFSRQMKKQGYYTKEVKNINIVDLPIRLPVIDAPLIFEVMTASTSGSDTEHETDIRSAFRNALLRENHTSPGINKRQVWGRMVTQLFAKTALAHAWGGQTLWIVQDELLRNIELTTLLRTSKVARKTGSDIQLVVMHYATQSDGKTTMALKESVTGDSGLDFGGDETFTDILLPKVIPPKLELVRAMLRRSLDAIVRL